MCFLLRRSIAEIKRYSIRSNTYSLNLHLTRKSGNFSKCQTSFVGPQSEFRERASAAVNPVTVVYLPFTLQAFGNQVLFTKN